MAAGSRQAPSIHERLWAEIGQNPACAASDQDGSCRRRAKPLHPLAPEALPPGVPKSAAAQPDESAAADAARWPPGAALQC